MTDFVSGDTGSKLVVTVRDSAGAIVDLTGATVRFKWRNETTLVEKVATITSAVGGVVEYQFLTGEIIAPEMKVEVEVTDGSGKVTTGLDLIELTVREQLT